SSAMEKEAVQNLADMFGFQGPVLGHLSSGGTFANLEALWIAGQLAPGKTVLASAQAHYTHSRICSVLGIPFEPVGIDANACMDLAALEQRLKAGDVACVVATLGTTGLGSVDNLPAIQALCETYQSRVHVDSAYGGYFILADGLDSQDAASFQAIGMADSVVVDPHKHGLQPYGCGSVLFKDPDVGRFYKHGSPYTYFSSDELHLGEISLECSRAGASAVALWATQKLLPMVEKGEFALGLDNSLRAARDLYQRIVADQEQIAFLKPSLDIVCWAPKANTSSEISRLSEALFHAAAEQDLHLATMTLDSDWLQPLVDDVVFDTPEVTVLRSCLMKPEHVDWLDEIWSRYKFAHATISR
ncbi:MAG: aminotransferase class I/II-fold pyridoxal phosphate-dependent enzyme, partial [Pseudomonadota bacterium]